MMMPSVTCVEKPDEILHSAPYILLMYGCEYFLATIFQFTLHIYIRYVTVPADITMTTTAND